MKLLLNQDNSAAVRERAKAGERSNTYALNAILSEWRDALKSGARMPKPETKAHPLSKKKK